MMGQGIMHWAAVHLVTHVWLLIAVGFHVLSQALLHGVDSVAYRTGELGDLRHLRHRPTQDEHEQQMQK